MCVPCSVRKVTRFDRVVRREICSVVTKGGSSFVCCYGYNDHTHSGTQVPLYQDHDRRDASSLYLLAVKEEGSAYGVCFIDTSIGTFHVSSHTHSRGELHH